MNFASNTIRGSFFGNVISKSFPDFVGLALATRCARNAAPLGRSPAPQLVVPKQAEHHDGPNLDEKTHTHNFAFNFGIRTNNGK